jgi:hypothetical protein
VHDQPKEVIHGITHKTNMQHPQLEVYAFVGGMLERDRRDLR